MGRVRRSITLAVAASFALLLGAGATRAASDTDVLATYEPVLVFDPHEAFRPSAVGDFIAHSQLERRDAAGTWAVANADPTAADVAAAVGPGWRLNERACSPALPLGGLSCYTAADTSSAPVVYARVVRSGNATVLQYW